MYAASRVFNMWPMQDYVAKWGEPDPSIVITEEDENGKGVPGVLRRQCDDGPAHDLPTGVFQISTARNKMVAKTHCEDDSTQHVREGQGLLHVEVAVE